MKFEEEFPNLKGKGIIHTYHNYKHLFFFKKDVQENCIDKQEFLDAFKELKLIIESIEILEPNEDAELVKKVCLEEIDKTEKEILK